MTDRIDPETGDDLVARLSALGTQPVPSAVQSQHLTAMAASARPLSAWSRFGRRAGIAAAFGVGLLAGTTGLAAAGALGPLQPIVAQGIEAATPLNVPQGPSDNADVKTSPDGFHGVARVTAGCVPADNGEFAINHGQYLKQERAKGPEALAAAKLTDCGKPLSEVGDSTESDTNDATSNQSGEHGKSGAHRVSKCDGNDNATENDTTDDATDNNATDDNEATDNETADDAGKPACTPSVASNTHANDHATNKSNGSSNSDHKSESGSTHSSDGTDHGSGSGRPATAGQDSSTDNSGD